MTHFLQNIIYVEFILSYTASNLSGRLPVRVRQLGQDQVGRGIHQGREDESAHGVREEGRQGLYFRTAARVYVTY